MTKRETIISSCFCLIFMILVTDLQLIGTESFFLILLAISGILKGK